MKKLNIDQEFKNLIPPLTEEEFKQLEENIREEGCRDALVVWDNTILDGHNRYEICNKHNIPFATKEAMVEDREEAIIWIIKNQFGRRNLPLHTRVKLAMQLEDTIKAQAKRNQEATQLIGRGKQKIMVKQQDAKPIHTNDQLGKIAGTSKETIRKYKVVQHEGSDELKGKVDEGEVTITTAYRQIRQPKTITPKEKPKSSSTAEIKKIIAELEKPLPTPLDNDLKSNTFDNPIISEIHTKLNHFNQDISKYIFMDYQITPQETKSLVQEVIEKLKTIDKKLKER